MKKWAWFMVVIALLLSACGASMTPEPVVDEELTTAGHLCKTYLKYGSRGDNVEFLQSTLDSALRHRVRDSAAADALRKSSLRKGSWDGVFGWGTYHAVVRFQKWAFPNSSGEWDGIVGPNTWHALDIPCDT